MPTLTPQSDELAFPLRAASIEEAIANVKENYPDFDYGGTVQVRHVMKFDM